MTEKVQINDDLKIQHGDVYKKFFCEHNLVFSTNNVIDWWIWIWESFNNFKIKQKVSTKTYCGVKFNQTWKMTLNKLYEFDWLEHTFVVCDFEDTVQDYSLIQKFLDDNYTAIWNKWIELSFICENPRGHGFGTGDIVSLLTVFAMMYTEWTITPNILKNYEEFLKSKLADELHHKARSFADILMDWRSTGSDIFVSMWNDPMPIVYVSKNIANKHLYENEKDKSKTIHKNIFDFLWIKNHEQELPFDFWVFYFGVDYDTDYVNQVSQIYKKEINEVQSYTHDLFEKNGIVDNDFYFWDLDYETFYDNFVEVWIILHFKLLRAFEKVLKNPLDENRIDKFIKIINEFWAFSIIIESSNTFLTNIRNCFDSLKLFDNEKIGICPLTLWKMWWSFLFVTPYKKSRRTISKMVEKYNYMWNKMHLEYASWIDWYAHDWLSIEQDISNNIFSEYLQSGSVVYKDNFGKNYIWDYNTIIEKESKWILLDCVEWKIYINWKDLTSKDLVSQSSTVEILDYLISNMWQTVPSKDLPYSSYSTQRNQMAGKIILPLKKLTKKYFGKEIDLDCAGWLWWFNLTLTEKEIKIWVVKNI